MTPRILILAAHPDDEIVACCTTITRVRRTTGAQFFILYLTHGCVARESAWPWQRARWSETIAERYYESGLVAHLLDLTPVDPWPQRPARGLWRDLVNAYQEVCCAVDQLSITELWVPAFEGGHPDHDALNALSSVVQRRGVSVREFAAYNWFGRQARSHCFPHPNGTEETTVLTKEEQALKQHALSLYASQAHNLRYVGLMQEISRPLPRYDYSTPPHDGTLWYERFQWVPFFHPAVNRTSPLAVAGYISGFLTKADGASFHPRKSCPTLSQHVYAIKPNSTIL